MAHMPAVAVPETSASFDTDTIQGDGTLNSKFSTVGFRKPHMVINGEIRNILDDPNDLIRILCYMRLRGLGTTTERLTLQVDNSATVDTTTEQRQCRAIEAQCDATRTAGANDLLNYAIIANASGGQSNFSWYSTNGYMHQTGGAFFGTAVSGIQIGTGTAAAAGKVQLNADLTVADAKTVTLGQTVQSFIMPGSAAVNPNIRIGLVSSTADRQIAVKNTVAGQFGGLTVHLDTDVTAAARGGLTIYRGSGAGSEVAGVNVAGGAGHFASGAVADDLVIHSYDPGAAGRSVCIASGSSPTVRIEVKNTGEVEIVSGATLKVTGNVGFYGATPIAQQTGVAVTAAAIHAALVSLGLITA